MQNHNIYTKFFAANANKTFLVFASGRNSGESLTGAQLLERCQMHWDEYPNQRCTENPNYIYMHQGMVFMSGEHFDDPFPEACQANWGETGVTLRVAKGVAHQSVFVCGTQTWLVWRIYGTLMCTVHGGWHENYLCNIVQW
jgi:hypothetical protein